MDVRQIFFISPPGDAKHTGPGIEEWSKRIGICLALLYVNGYAAFRTYAGSYGLSPSDFGLAETDYVMKGVAFLVFDTASILSPRWQFLLYYVLVIVSWLVIAYGFHLALVRVSVGNFRATAHYTALLGIVFIALDVLAAHQGRLRADLDVDGFDSLPYVVVTYESPDAENDVDYACAQVVARTEKVICLANVSYQKVGTNISTNNDGHLLVIPSERLILIKFSPPPDTLLDRALSRNSQ